MLRIFRQIGLWLTRDPVLHFRDEHLGEMTFQESWWECTLDGPDGDITLAVGGHNEPDPMLLERGRTIQEDLDSFLNRLQAYLAEESQTQFGKQCAEEIMSLKVSSINILSPSKPKLGMVYFDGPDELRLWHCDIDSDRFWGLTFDT